MIQPQAGLILDSAKGILMGSIKGPVVDPDDPGESKLFMRVALPDNHDHVMPPGEYEKLTRIQMLYLKRWITEGTDFGEWVGNEKGFAAFAAALGLEPDKSAEVTKAPEKATATDTDATGTPEITLSKTGPVSASLEAVSSQSGSPQIQDTR